MNNSLVKFFVVCGACVSMVGHAATYILDKSHTGVGFRVKHLVISNVNGSFKKFDGKFDFDEKTGMVSNINIDIDPSSIDTNEPKRDDHLRSPDFFDVKKYPKLTFVASGATKVEQGKEVPIKGILTIHGVSKDVVLNTTYNGVAKNPWGKFVLSFSAATSVNRKDFGLVWNKALETGGVLVGEEVKINIEGEATTAK